MVPAQLGSLMAGKDPKKSAAAMKAMLGMKKLDIAALKKAYENG